MTKLVPVELREATSADAGAIARLHAESWRTAYRGIYNAAFLDGPVFDDRASVWRDRLHAPAAGQCVLLAERGSSLEGFICGFGAEDERWGSLIDNLHVTPGHKRAGTGTTLMRAGAAWLRERYPRSGVYLWVLEANAPARRFYERLGARNAETLRHDNVGGSSSLACRYVWESPSALERGCA